MWLFKKKPKIEKDPTKIDYRDGRALRLFFIHMNRQFDDLQKTKFVVSVLVQELIDIQRQWKEGDKHPISYVILELAEERNITEKEAFNLYCELKKDQYKAENTFKIFRDSIFEDKNMIDKTSVCRLNQFELDEVIQIALDLGFVFK